MYPKESKRNQKKKSLYLCINNIHYTATLILTFYIQVALWLSLGIIITRCKHCFEIEITLLVIEYHWFSCSASIDLKQKYFIFSNNTYLKHNNKNIIYIMFKLYYTSQCFCVSNLYENHVVFLNLISIDSVLIRYYSEQLL